MCLNQNKVFCRSAFFSSTGVLLMNKRRAVDFLHSELFLVNTCYGIIVFLGVLLDFGNYWKKIKINSDIKWLKCILFQVEVFFRVNTSGCTVNCISLLSARCTEISLYILTVFLCAVNSHTHILYVLTNTDLSMLALCPFERLRRWSWCQSITLLFISYTKCDFYRTHPPQKK